MSEDKIKQVAWRAALIRDGAEPALAKVVLASETGFELQLSQSFRIGEPLKLFLDVLNADRKTHEYIPMQVKVVDIVLVAKAKYYRCHVKLSQIDAGPKLALGKALELSP